MGRQVNSSPKSPYCVTRPPLVQELSANPLPCLPTRLSCLPSNSLPAQGTKRLCVLYSPIHCLLRGLWLPRSSPPSAGRNRAEGHLQPCRRLTSTFTVPQPQGGSSITGRVTGGYSSPRTPLTSREKNPRLSTASQNRQDLTSPSPVDTSTLESPMRTKLEPNNFCKSVGKQSLGNLQKLD